MAKRSQRASIAAETLQILERGAYTATGSVEVSIAAELQHAVSGTQLYAPDANIGCATNASRISGLQIEVVNATTLAAAKAIVDADPSHRVVCLNFASAKNPGGGFLGGSQAQEESLARASGLYACLLQAPQYYEANRNCSTCLYTDHVIYSPDVPVFRDDEDILLEHPYVVSMITAPAVNVGALRRNEAHGDAHTESTMRRRISRLLEIGIAHGHRTFVLGAWGCGVFKNDPAKVADWFYDELCGGKSLVQALDHVVFAVLDNTPKQETIGPFQARFAEVNYRY